MAGEPDDMPVSDTLVDRQVALDRIVELIETHGLSVDEIASRLDARPARADQKGLVAQLLGYLGGIFVFAGVGLLISFVWDDIGSAQRVILSVGSGLSAFVLGLVSVRDVRLEKARTPLFLISAFLQPFGLFVYADEYLPPETDSRLVALAIFAVLAAQHGIVFRSLRYSVLLFLTILFAVPAMGTAMDLLTWDDEVIAIVIGGVTLGVAWAIGRTAYRGVTPSWFFVGGATLLTGWWSLTEGTMFDLSNLGLNAFLVYVSIRTASRTLLFVSVVGLLSYLSYFAYEHFADVIGWPLTLIALGLVLIGISGWAVKLGRGMK